MKIKVAITSSDGEKIDQHFGWCSDFRIAEIDSNSENFQMIENRKTEQTCHDFSHQEEHVKEVAELLSDCRYLLTYRIGVYPYTVFQNLGITCVETPTEEPVSIEWAFEWALKRLQKHLARHQAPA